MSAPSRSSRLIGLRSRCAYAFCTFEDSPAAEKCTGPGSLIHPADLLFCSINHRGGAMNKTVLKSFCLLTMLLLATSAALADTKSRTKSTASGRSFESTTYIKGARQRTEQNVGMGLAMINQCDLKRMIQLNDKARTYMVISTDPQNSPKAPTAPEQPNAKTQKPGEGKKAASSPTQRPLLTRANASKFLD